MFKRIKKYFSKPEEVETPGHEFTEFEKRPLDVRIKGRVVGIITYHVDWEVWIFTDHTSHPYTFHDLLKIAFKLNSLNN